MAEETTTTPAVTETVTDTGTTTTAPETTTGSPETTTAPGTTAAPETTTVEKPEFSDPNMQKAWTEKTQKLAEERRTWEAQVADFNKSKSDYEKKAALFDKFDSDPEIVSFIKKRFGVEDKPSITPEELMEAQSDPAKLEALIQKAARKLVTPVAERMSNLELENTLTAYADAKGNEDFWELYDAGLIKDKMVALRNSGTKSSDMDMLKQAHLEARGIMNAVNARAEKLAQEKASGLLAQKKAAITDKGGRSSVSTTGKSFKGKSITDVANEILASAK